MHPGKHKAAMKLKTARGQIDGIIKMIEEDRYCVDISTQILSIIGLLKKSQYRCAKLPHKILRKGGYLEGEKEGGEKKIEEIVTIIDKYIK